MPVAILAQALGFCSPSHLMPGQLALGGTMLRCDVQLLKRRLALHLRLLWVATPAPTITSSTHTGGTRKRAAAAL